MSRARHHTKAAHKHGGHVKHHAAGGTAIAGGNPHVLHEAEATKNIGHIEGGKSKVRLDRKRGGKVAHHAHHAHGGAAHSDAAEDRAMIHHMVKPSAMKKHGGKVSHCAHGGATGADTHPFSSAHKHGGKVAHHGGRHH